MKNFMPPPAQLRALLGEPDIYVLDLLLKGYFREGIKILDAGCGYGRNSWYFIKAGLNVHGIDPSAEDIAYLQQFSKEHSGLPVSNFKIASLPYSGYTENEFDLIICNAVLHFAATVSEYESWLFELYRILKPGGHLFVRTACLEGTQPIPIAEQPHRYLLADGSTRLLLPISQLSAYTRSLGAKLTEPLKYTCVEGVRSMTTWVVEKRGPKPSPI